MYDITLQTDAYHMTMGYLITSPLEFETHVLYARSGGPQVVPNLAEILQRILASAPTRQQVTHAAAYWHSQGIPFPEQAWFSFAAAERMPITVRGVLDGEVVLPGDPIAVFTGPAALVAALEPILIGELMTSIQVATRLVKVGAALAWDLGRVFEVGLRAASSYEDHLAKLRVLRRMGLRLTSNGAAAAALGLKPVGTMGHRYTQRFQGSDADYQAFDQAVSRMVKFRKDQGIPDKLSLSFLLDTRATLTQGLPAALRVIQHRGAEIAANLHVGVRLDSGALQAQLRVVIRAFASALADSPVQPHIILESGLKARDIAACEAIATELGFDRTRLVYGVGGYLVSGIDRDAISLVFKITGFGGDSARNTRDHIPTMKFADEADGGKESYPGQLELWEHMTVAGPTRLLALSEESAWMEAHDYQRLLHPLVENGVLWGGALRRDAVVQAYACQRWTQLTGDYLADGRDWHPDGASQPRRRPQYSAGMTKLVAQLRARQLQAQG